MGIGAFGTVLKVGDAGAPEVFTAVAEVQNIGGPALALELIDITHHSSTNKWREKVAGLLNAGQVTLDINYDPDNATHAAGTNGLVGLLKNRTKRNMKIEFSDPTPTVWSFAAFVTGFQPGAPKDDRLSASVTIEITGEPTLA